jgi:hypothetical protein
MGKGLTQRRRDAEEGGPAKYANGREKRSEAEAIKESIRLVGMSSLPRGMPPAAINSCAHAGIEGVNWITR